MTPVLLLCGPPVVGKSVVGFEVFVRLARAGVKTAYVDLAQLDFLRFSNKDQLASNKDPRSSNEDMRSSDEAMRLSNEGVRVVNEGVRSPNHERREANLRAVWPGFRDAGVRQVVVSGDVRTYSIPDTTLTVFRLRAGPAQLTERVLARGRGEGPPIPGDELRGRDPRYLHEFARHAARVAAQLDRDRPDDLCVDTDGRTIAEVAESVVALAGR